MPDLSKESILKIHHHLLFLDTENAGSIRNFPVHINNKQLMPYEKIEEYLKNLLSLDKKELFEWNFENIHPFIDGNGRCGRMIINFQLISNGFLPINIKFKDS